MNQSAVFVALSREDMCIDIHQSEDLAGDCIVYEHGWQATAFRPERAASDSGLQGEGLLAVVIADCVHMRAEAERPEPWLEYVRAHRWLAQSSDPLRSLDSVDLKGLRNLMVASAAQHEPKVPSRSFDNMSITTSIE
jgi:hypothetical protein